MTKGSNT